MRYTVGKISEQSGLTAQTIREYANRGMLENCRDSDNKYRYFGASAVNRTGVIRRMRMRGFTLDEVEEILTGISKERYSVILKELIEQRQKNIEYQCDVLRFLHDHQESIAHFDNDMDKGELIIQPKFYCLDYRRNGELICSDNEEQVLLNEWMGQSVFMCNYSPYPQTLLKERSDDQVIGLLINSDYVKYVSVKPPVYIRESCLCARFFIRHDDKMHLLPDGPGFVWKYLNKNKLEISGEPFFTGEIAFENEGDTAYYGCLYVPVRA